MANHVVLLGDSILDNGAYTGGRPDVVSHLQTLLPEEWKASLCAVDGSTTGDLEAQLTKIPGDATHCVISMGGNDALQGTDLLVMPVKSTGETLDLFWSRMRRFEVKYRSALLKTLALGLRTTLCTIYNGAFPPAEEKRITTVLMMYNDVILRAAVQHHLHVIELRLVCTEPEDYKHMIEPSASGGAKVARAIATSLEGTDHCTRVVGV